MCPQGPKAPLSHVDSFVHKVQKSQIELFTSQAALKNLDKKPVTLKTSILIDI